MVENRFGSNFTFKNISIREDCSNFIQSKYIHKLVNVKFSIFTYNIK